MYLLAPKARNDKSKWLNSAGYTVENWEQLEADIRKQLLSLDAALDEINEYGSVYRIAGLLVGPNGQTLNVVSIWMTEHLSRNTKFITMYPR